MGFIATGDTFHLSAYLTQRGRELLLNGAEADITATVFSLGDSDSNYKIEFPLSEGFVPDLTGDNSDCVISLANNVGIKYSLPYNTNVAPEVKKSTVMFQRTDNSQYYNVLDCLIHLDSIGRYQLYNSSGNLSNPNRLKANNNLSSPFQDLFQSVAIVKTPSLSPTDFDTPDSMVFEMLFDPNIYKKLNNTYIDSSANSTINQTNGGVSPIVLTFSSTLNASGSTLYGAGKGSVGIYNREIGYAYKGETDTNWTFNSAAQTETVKNYVFYTDANNTLLNKYASFTVAAKIDAKDNVTGVMSQFIYRGDQNLTNLSDSTLASFTNETRFANQYAKLYEMANPIVNGIVSTASKPSLMALEIANLKDFIQTSGLFTQTSGTNEFRTSKLTFSVYPKNNGNTVPATLNIIFSFNDDILMAGDSDTAHITSEGDKVFIQYDFTSTNGVFKNRAKTGSYARNNCGSGSVGTVETYSVPVGAYTGSTQSIADTLAQNDINANGQAYANSVGQCSVQQQFASTSYAQYVQKTDCGAGYYGDSIYVTFPAGQFHSYISQFDADQQASYAAQLQANSQGGCNAYATGGGGSGGGGGGCLLAGQRLFVNEQGDIKNIEDFEVGDTVYTYHEHTLELGTHRVYKTFKGQVNKWYTIVTEQANFVKCSPSHLFMINGEAKRADELHELHDSLQINIDGELVNDNILHIEVTEETVDIYNIEVEDAHTYITENGIWHHNKLTPIRDEPVQADLYLN